MEVEIGGKGSITGQQAPSLVRALVVGFEKRPKFVGALLMLLLALNGGLVYAGAAFTVPKGREASDPVQVFVSYSRKDAEYLEQISLPGAVEDALKEEGIVFWRDQDDIVPGDHWDKRIRKAIAASDIALVLVSENYLHSGYCSKEIRILLNKANEDTKLLPVILSTCDWRSYDWLAEPQCLPGGEETVKENYEDPKKREELFSRIQDGLRKQAENVRKERREKRSLFRRVWKPRRAMQE
jgi:hypothetical protein